MQKKSTHSNSTSTEYRELQQLILGQHQALTLLAARIDELARALLADRRHAHEAPMDQRLAASLGKHFSQAGALSLDWAESSGLQAAEVALLREVYGKTSAAGTVTQVA